MNLVKVVGSGHHERAAYACGVIARLRALGFDVEVHTDLRPRLAADMAGLLQAGARAVTLDGEGIHALVVGVADREALSFAAERSGAAVVEVVLEPGGAETRAELVAADGEEVSERIRGALTE